MVGRIVVKIVKLLVEVSVLQYLRNGWWYRCENCSILLVAVPPIRRNKENLKIVGGSACFAISPDGWWYRCENCQIVGVSACFAISPEWLVVSKENFQIVGVSACFAISPEWLVVSL
ncbi:unnamed protein product [Schistosoma mattheei]|uniref:Uncharacterized protein n=1 Tax=Schistosoma mattheei TaxID=31246 RepID=A0A183PWP7_9TREM|nr:unnamed protein product [Schistosoma mattheei]